MKHPLFKLVVTCCFIFSASWSQALPERPTAAPLFASSEPLELTLRGPFDRMSAKRDKEEEYEGVAIHGEDSLDVKLSLRGNFRLRRDICSHPPLWLNFKKKQVEGTLFEGQDKLKLVVQCRNGDDYQDFLGLEYKLYQMFRVLSPVSLDARPVWVTYEDTEEGETRRQLAFIIQHHKRLAASMDLTVVDDNKISYRSLNAEQSSLVALFMYVIASTDYSMTMSAEGSCCHNTKALRDEQGVVYPLPYDFDQTGFVSPAYAQVSAGIGQRSIRHRIYRGYCVDESVLKKNVEHILGNREALEAIAADDTLVDSRRRRRAAELLDKGLNLLSNESRFNREVVRKCLG